MLPFAACTIKNLENTVTPINNRVVEIETFLSRPFWTGTVTAATIGRIKDFSISAKPGQSICVDIDFNNTFQYHLYLIKTENPLVYENIYSGYKSENHVNYIFSNDAEEFTKLRFYKISASDNDSTGTISFNLLSANATTKEYVDSNIENVNTRITNIDAFSKENKALISATNARTLISTKDRLTARRDYRIDLRKGDIFVYSFFAVGNITGAAYLMKSNSDYIQLSSRIYNQVYMAQEDGFNVFRIYTEGSTDPNAYLQVFWKIIPNDIVVNTFNNKQSWTGTIAASKTNVIEDFPVRIQAGQTLCIDSDFDNNFNCYLYLLRTVSPLSYVLVAGGNGVINHHIEYKVEEDTFTILRFYKMAASDNDNTGTFYFSVLPKEYTNLKETVQSEQTAITELQNAVSVGSYSDFVMCLPKKVFMAKGLSYNIYKSSIMIKPNINISMFTAPLGETNIQADDKQCGEICKLDNLNDCTLRIGLRDYKNINSQLIHKDLAVVYNTISSPITKKVNVIGDSITNRGAAYFAKLAAESINCTINNFGTIVNYHNTYGEGREGWTFANFIGKSNTCGAGTITPMGTGTSGSITKNPFLREATAQDLVDYPQWCFPSTGVKKETPYSEDSSQATYYIFDYAYYLSRWPNNEHTPDVVTIALGTNDYIQGWTKEEYVAFAEFMVSRIKAAVPTVKIGILPSPAWGASFNFGNIVPYIELIKTTFENEVNVEIVGLWCFMSRYLSFGLKPSDNTAANPSTDITPYQDYIHFDNGDGGKRAYIEYGKILASFVLTQ